MDCKRYIFYLRARGQCDWQTFEVIKNKCKQFIKL